jgi:putative ABC transport system permease protein
MSHEHHMRRLSIMGLESRPSLNRVLDDTYYAPEMPTEGLILSKKLAELLGVKVGDVVTIEILEGQRAVREVAVSEIISDYSGTNAYMEIRALHRLTGDGETYSGAYLTVDSRHSDELYKEFKEAPRVAGVGIKDAAVKGFEQTMEENMAMMRTFNVIFAVIIAVGVVYNTARISLAERSRELATLRVLGFTRQEISGILLGELTVLTLVALPLGMVMGFCFVAVTVTLLETDLFRIPLVINASTYAFAVTVVLLATIVSGYVVQRMLVHLDLVAVLKSKE